MQSLKTFHVISHVALSSLFLFLENLRTEALKWFSQLTNYLFCIDRISGVSYKNFMKKAMYSGRTKQKSK